MAPGEARMRLVSFAAALCALAIFCGGAVALGQHPRSVKASSAGRLTTAESGALDRTLWLASPAARAERQRSRTAFRGRFGASARRLAAQTFRSLVQGPL